MNLEEVRAIGQVLGSVAVLVSIASAPCAGPFFVDRSNKVAQT